ncbi:uncharacterized protein LOC119736164 [Patiria miniata]|uniref:Fucolectin tachylectin-4 pentraxin-1 domain-containing protein n=1 Tax=Patiria miniata TaxID=46514 RepID=A0A914AQ00_PATMI|nr:uncharacterized protein LOC119736164 [Patiria miniata]
MAFLLLICLLAEIALMTEARVCSLGNEPDPDLPKVTHWVTLPVRDPCDCSVIVPGGFNTVPVLQRGGSPYVRTHYPMVSSDPKEIGSHFGCDPIQQGVHDATVEPHEAAVTSPNLPHSEWIKLMYYDRSDPNSIEPDHSVLDKWKSSQITEVKISLRGNSSGLDLSFDARGSNSTSWFTYDRLLNSPWKDLDHNAIFRLNWTAKGADILGIHAELRRSHPVEGWLLWVPSGADEAQRWGTGKLPVIAFARTLNKVHWMDRDVLSRGRPSIQSSTPAPARGEYGVDSEPRTRASTAYEFQPWWMVDMGGTFSLEEIVITACAPGAGKTELTGAQFRVGVSQAIDEGTLCGSPVREPAGESTSLTILCPNNMPSARYLGMKIDGENGVLGFCDIVLDADGGPSPMLVGRPTWQSSVLARNASLCVDGLVGVHEADLTCCQTDEESDSWWQVDLGEVVTVTMVVISPFPDLTKWTDMAGATIAVGNDDDPFVLSAETCGGALAVEDLQKHRPLLVECVPSVNGRYVFIRGNNKPVSMCEVEVFGRAKGDVFYADTLSIHALVTEQ